MKIIEQIYKRILEGVLFVIVIVLLFNLFVDFGANTGIISIPLETPQIQYLGLVSAGLAFLNILSGKFFEIKLVS